MDSDVLNPQSSDTAVGGCRDPPGATGSSYYQPPTGERYKLNVAYAKSQDGILRIPQMVLSMLTFGLAMSAVWVRSGGGWVTFVSINGFIQALIWFCLHLFSAIQPIMANHFIETIMYGLLTVFYLVAGIVAACSSYGDGVVGAAAFFCFLCLVLFGIDTVIQILNIRDRYYSPARNRGRLSIQAASASDLPPPPYSTLVNPPTSADPGAYNKAVY